MTTVISDEVVERAAYAYDHAGNKPTMGTFHAAMRAALEAVWPITSESGGIACEFNGDFDLACALGDAARVAYLEHGKDAWVTIGKAIVARLNHAALAQSTQGECEGCNGRGEVGGLTPQGYDGEECPVCHGTGKDAERARVPEALYVWANVDTAPAGDPMYEAARGHVREMLKAAPSQPAEGLSTSPTEDMQWCDTHGMFHPIELRDPDCEFPDSQPAEGER